MSDSQTSNKTITDHPFRPSWREQTLCSFEAHDETRCKQPQTAHRYSLQLPIEIEVWKPHPQRDEPGFEHFKGTVVLDYRRKVQDVLSELNAKLLLEGIEPDEYGFANMTKYDDPAYLQEGAKKYTQYSIPWPKYRRIAVFPVTGGSEGHYVHVETISHQQSGNDPRIATLIGLSKTFRGWDHACRIAAAAGRLLQA